MCVCVELLDEWNEWMNEWDTQNQNSEWIEMSEWMNEIMGMKNPWATQKWKSEWIEMRWNEWVNEEKDEDIWMDGWMEEEKKKWFDYY